MTRKVAWVTKAYIVNHSKAYSFRSANNDNKKEIQSRPQLIRTIFGRTRADKMAPRFAAIPSTARDRFGVVDRATLGVELTADVVDIEVVLPVLHRSPWQQSNVQLKIELLFPYRLHAATWK